MGIKERNQEKSWVILGNCAICVGILLYFNNFDAEFMYCIWPRNDWPWERRVWKHYWGTGDVIECLGLNDNLEVKIHTIWLWGRFGVVIYMHSGSHYCHNSSRLWRLHAIICIHCLFEQTAFKSGHGWRKSIWCMVCSKIQAIQWPLFSQYKMQCIGQKCGHSWISPGTTNVLSLVRH